MLTKALRSISDSSTARRGEIVGIQYLRGLAAAAVVVTHASSTSAFPKYFDNPSPSRFLDAGNVGVPLFFVISGFIIAIVSLREGTLLPRIKKREFFVRRFARIVPLLWLAVISYALLRLLGRGFVDVPATLRSMVLWPVGEVDPKNVWTLRHELIFYVVFAATFLGQRLSRWFLMAWVIAPLILGFTAYYWGSAVKSELLQSIFNGANLFFGAGVVLALFWLRKKPEPIKIRADALLFMCGFLLLTGAMTIARENTSPTAVQLVALILCSGLVFAAVRLAPHGKGNRAGLLFGNASYAIYLFHPHILSALLGVWAKLAPGTHINVVIWGTSLAAVFAGIVVHVLIEKPLVNVALIMFGQRPKSSLGEPHRATSSHIGEQAAQGR